MQKIVILVSVIAASFIAGYFSYPYVHNTESIAKITDSAGRMSNSKEQDAEATDTKLDPIIVNDDKKREFAEASNKIANKNDVELTIDTDRTVFLDNDESDKYTNQTPYDDTTISASEVQAIKVWQEAHKLDLRETITANVPASIAQGLIDKVFKGNAFLDEVVGEKGLLKDEAWAQQMRQLISDSIQTHALSNKVEVFTIVCKYSTCEVTGRSAELGAWQKVNISIYTQLFSGGHQLNMEASKNVAYVDEGQEYFYSQFVFK